MPSPTQTPLPDPSTAPALKTIYAPHFAIGAAIEPGQLSTSTDAALRRKHYNSTTAENAMKADTIAPSFVIP